MVAHGKTLESGLEIKAARNDRRVALLRHQIKLTLVPNVPYVSCVAESLLLHLISLFYYHIPINTFKPLALVVRSISEGH